jgi:hypothetical protein
MTDLAPEVPPAQAEIDYTWNLANKLCKTEFVPQNLRGKPEATLAVFLTGRELGIGPMQSLRDIYPVNGRPALMASLMVARVRGLGHRFRTVISDDRRAIVQIHRKGEPEPEPQLQFTIDDAKRAELTGKAVWRQYPKAMLWNRAASAACRRDCPEALGGAVYTPEEIEDGSGATTATWGAPEIVEQQSETGMSATSDASGDGASHTSGTSVSDPSSDPPGSAPPAAGGSDTNPTRNDREDGDALPLQEDGEGSVDVGGDTPTKNAAVANADPTPPTESPVGAWCEQHDIDIRIARTFLRRSHAREFPNLRDRKDLEELRGEEADKALRYLEAQYLPDEVGQ